MTHLRINTNTEGGSCSIELSPIPDETSWDMVHELGIRGISRISERTDKNGECMTLSFDHSPPAKIQSDALALARAFEQTGTVVKVNEQDDSNTAPVRRKGRLALLAKLGA